MTVTQRKPQHKADDIPIVNEPGDLYQCDSCSCDLTHTIRMKCADPVCEQGDGVDICPSCFCSGKEFGNHKRWHPYRVIEINSYPIFTDDWGADEELLLIKGIASQGFGNWKKIAEVVGTRTKEEVEEHYNKTYIDSANWPLPPMDRHFDVDPAEFQERKRRRISELNSAPIPPAKATPVSLPGIHEVAGFFPGRLEFEHERDNEAEDLVKDLEFGVCLAYGGDAIPEDPDDLDVKARVRWEEERCNGGAPAQKGVFSGKGVFNGLSNGIVSSFHSSSSRSPELKKDRPSQSEDKLDGDQNGNGEEDGAEEVTQPPPIETQDSLTFKLTLLEMYFQRVQKRQEDKAVMYDRGLLDYKKMQALDKKRPREERELLHRLRSFARLQTAADYEVFTADILYEALLRKRIKELQEYRRLGLVTAADIERYEDDVAKRTQAKTSNSHHHNSDRLQFRAPGRQSTGPSDDRRSHDREAPTSAPARKPAAPLNLANSPCLHLLTPGEQTLCSQLRILPKPYLVIKETLVREYARRGGKLRRREARDLVKVDVSKTARVWDFLVQAGFLKITSDFDANANNASSTPGPTSNALAGGSIQSSPRPPTAIPSTSSTPVPASSIPSTGWQPPP